MITVLPCKDKEEIKKRFLNLRLEYSENSGFVSAKSGDEELGFCLYYLDEKGIRILNLEPQNDIMLADGVLRSALHVAAERSAMDARYADTAPVELFKKLDFINNEDEHTLNIDKLFGGCGCKAPQ